MIHIFFSLRSKPDTALLEWVVLWRHFPTEVAPNDWNLRPDVLPNSGHLTEEEKGKEAAGDTEEAGHDSTVK